jgi:AAA+ ATPase superfamily predicted ATPase
MIPFLNRSAELERMRRALAVEIARHVKDFDAVEYPEWDSLLSRFWESAPAKLCLVIDELPALVQRAPELPSLLQKLLDRRSRPLAVCGSSQRMMHGLVLEAGAPLYGRAREILKLAPLGIEWIRAALDLRSPADAVEHYALWGGVPRYWELARAFQDRRSALRELVLDPLGVLHREPDRLLLDDAQDIARSASLLSLIGRGAHRVSEIGARIGVPATSLSRPLARLMELGLIVRELPFGRSERDTKRTRYRLDDPFLAFWYRFVEPNRSRLEAGLLEIVAEEIEASWPLFLGSAWESIVRTQLPRLVVEGRRFGPASRWWGPATDKQPMEIDLVAEDLRDPRHVLVGEAKLSATPSSARAALATLAANAARCPELAGRRITCALWVLRARGRLPAGVYGPSSLLQAP